MVDQLDIGRKLIFYVLDCNVDPLTAANGFNGCIIVYVISGTIKFMPI